MYNGSEEVFLYLRSPSTHRYYRLSGIQNASFSHSTNESSTRLLLSDEQKTGRLMQRTNRRFSSPQSVSCSFDKCYINQDFIKTFTGLNNVSGAFLYGDSYLAFDDAVINQYSVTLTPSQIPKISVDMDIYGNLQPTGASSFKAHEEKQDFY